MPEPVPASPALQIRQKNWRIPVSLERGVSTYGFPEPLLIPNQVAETEITRRVAAYSRVLLVGFGGDPVLYPDSSYWYNLLKKGQVGHLLLDGWRYIRTQHRLPRVGLRANLRAWLAKFDRQEPLPDWFNPDFAQRVDLRSRLAEILASTPQNQRNGMTDAPLWSNIFAWSDPGFTGLPVKVRFPFFDLRLLKGKDKDAIRDDV